MTTTEPFSIKVNQDEAFQLQPDEAKSLDVLPLDDQNFQILKDGKSYRAELVEADFAHRQFKFRIAGQVFEVKIADHYERLVQKMGLAAGGNQKQNTVKAPMPGLVLAVPVEAGQAVSKGETLVILEAMKMENIIKAASDGRVKTVKIQKGAAVEKGQLLLELE